MKNEQHRIVVTGLGIVSVIGQDVASFFANACAGTVNIGKVESIDVSRMNSGRGAEILNFDIQQHFPDRDDIAKLGRAKQLALAAAKQCLQSAQFPIAEHAFEVGVALGYTQGESKTMEMATDHIAVHGANGEVDLDAFSDFAPQSVPQQIAKEFGLNGPILTIGNACSASNFAIGLAMDVLRRGDAVAMLAGGADAFSRYGYSGFSRLGAISPDVPRPFSADRQGMVPGEGAAMLMLETLESAQQRGAHIYAEVIGYGESCDAFHITQPDPSGIVQAASAALRTAGIDASAISFISAHGTGTQASDKAEARAFAELFGAQIPPVTSIKSMIGHAMGAASSMECVAAVCSIQEQIFTPTMNFLSADELCPLDCVPNQARRAPVQTVLKTASAFGGNNAAVIFSQFAH